jgi:hypothetical protein
MFLVISLVVLFVLLGAFLAFLVWWFVQTDDDRHGRM